MIVIIIFLFLIIAILVGYILKIQTKQKLKPIKIDDGKKDRQKQIKESFDNLMTYDFEVAIRRKR